MDTITGTAVFITSAATTTSAAHTGTSSIATSAPVPHTGATSVGAACHTLRADLSTNAGIDVSISPATPLANTVGIVKVATDHALRPAQEPKAALAQACFELELVCEAALVHQHQHQHQRHRQQQLHGSRPCRAGTR